MKTGAFTPEKMWKLRRAAILGGTVACVYVMLWYFVTFFALLRAHEAGPDDTLSDGSRGAIAISASIICALAMVIHSLMIGGASSYQPQILSVYLNLFWFVYLASFVHDLSVLSLLCEKIADSLAVSTVSVGLVGTAFIFFVGVALITTYINVRLLKKAILKKSAHQSETQTILHV